MKHYFFLTLLMVSFFIGTTQAQQRQCNLSIELVSPAEGAVINSMAEFDVIVNLSNNGPDSLLAGDTLYYHSPLMFVFDYSPIVLTHGIAPNAMRVITLEEILNENENTADEQLDFCVTVRHHLEDNGNFVDEELEDNTSCNNITLKPTFPTSITDRNRSLLLRLYPNPAQELIHLELPANLEKQAQLTIYDLTGRKLHSRQLSSLAAGSTINIDLQEMVPGTYVLEILNGGQRSAALFSRL